AIHKVLQRALPTLGALTTSEVNSQQHSASIFSHRMRYKQCVFFSTAFSQPQIVPIQKQIHYSLFTQISFSPSRETRFQSLIQSRNRRPAQTHLSHQRR